MKNPAAEALRLFKKLLKLDPAAGRALVQILQHTQIPTNEAVEKDKELFTAEGCISPMNFMDSCAAACGSGMLNFRVSYSYRGFDNPHGTGLSVQDADIVRRDESGKITPDEKPKHVLALERVKECCKVLEETADVYRGRNMFDLNNDGKKVVIELVRLGYLKANRWAIGEITDQLKQTEKEPPTHPGEKYVNPTSDVGACYIYYKWCTESCFGGPAPIVSHAQLVGAAKTLASKTRGDLSTWQWWTAKQLTQSGYMHEVPARLKETHTGGSVYS